MYVEVFSLMGLILMNSLVLVIFCRVLCINNEIKEFEVEVVHLVQVRTVKKVMWQESRSWKDQIRVSEGS